MSGNHHSKSGPVIVRKVHDPIPLTPAQEEARLLQMLAILEGNIATRETWLIREHARFHTDRRLCNLITKRTETRRKLDEIRGL